MHPTCTSQTQHMAKASTGQESAVTRCKFASSSGERGNAHSPCVTPNTLMSVTFIAPQAFISQFQVSPNVHFTNTITAQPRTHSCIPKHRFRSECKNYFALIVKLFNLKIFSGRCPKSSLFQYTSHWFGQSIQMSALTVHLSPLECRESLMHHLHRRYCSAEGPCVSESLCQWFNRGKLSFAASLTLV